MKEHIEFIEKMLDRMEACDTRRKKFNVLKDVYFKGMDDGLIMNMSPFGGLF